MTTPSDKWKMLPDWTLEKSDAELRVDSEKHSAMSGDVDRVKIKVKIGKRAVWKNGCRL